MLAALVTCPRIAEAHSPIKGLGTFYNHLLHPLLVPAHALLLIAVALLLGQQGCEVAGRGLIVFALGLAAGLFASSAGPIPGVHESVLLVGCLVVGGAVSLGLRTPNLITLGVAGIAGVGIGLDFTPEASALRESTLAYAGLTTGTLYLAAVVAGLTINPVQHWQRVGVRIAGSWIVAASVLVLALALARPATEAAAFGLSPREARPC
ncbi:MAG: HupE/UreJ family protein [Hyphomicrobiaceae bacterium]